MPDAFACPDRRRLEKLVLGRLAGEEADQLEEHVSACARCSNVLGSLQFDDDLVQAMRAATSAEIVSEQKRADAYVPWLKRLRRGDDATRTVTASHDTVSPEPSSFSGFDFLAPPQTPEELGRLGPYIIRRALGAGGMGMVFLAEDPRLERQIALKVIRPDLLERGDARQRFLSEARAIAKIEHDHIIAVYEVEEANEVPYLAMPLLRGESLEERLRRESGPLPVDELLRIGREIAAGLAAAHEKGLIHRDIKPANVFLTAETAESAERTGFQVPPVAADPTGNELDAPPSLSVSALSAASTIKSRVKILDFGLARAIRQDAGEQSQLGVVVGTPAYMAPEQARGLAVDGRADLFSLGCVLYRMATGQQPFKAHDMMALLIQIAVDQPPPPRELNPQLPPRVESLIHQLLEKKPEDRPASAQEVVATLAEIEEARAAARRPKPKRWPWLVGSLTAVAAAIALTIYLQPTPVPVVKSVVIPPLPPEPAVVTFQLDEPDQRLILRRGDDPEEEIDLKKARKHELKAGSYTVRCVVKSARKLMPGQFTLKEGETRTIDLCLVGEVRQDPNHTRTVWGVAVAGQGKDLLVWSAENDHTIGVWKAGTEEKSSFIAEEHGGPVFSITMTPDQKLAVSGGGGRGRLFDAAIRIWDVSKKTVLGKLKGHEANVMALALTPNGQRLLSGDASGKIFLWDVPRQKQLQEWVGHDGNGVYGVAFSSDGKQAATAGGDRQVLLWEVAQGVMPKKLGEHDRDVRCVVFAPKGNLVASGGLDGTIRLWDLKTGGMRRILKGHNEGTYGLSFSPDGQRLLSGGGDGTEGKVRLWDVNTGQEIVTLEGHRGAVYGVAYVADGRHAVSCDNRQTVRLWALPK